METLAACAKAVTAAVLAAAAFHCWKRSRENRRVQSRYPASFWQHLREFSTPDPGQTRNYLGNTLYVDTELYDSGRTYEAPIFQDGTHRASGNDAVFV